MSWAGILGAPRLSEVEGGRANNLNLIRFCLASLVIFSHSYLLAGVFDREPFHLIVPQSDLGSIAVTGFFFISGYLIFKSALRWSHPADYLASRFLRIFPALVAVTLLCAMLLGPLVTTLTPSAYFRSPGFPAYLSEGWMHHMQHHLPGVFETRPYPAVVNGPLWTLPVEWCLYIVVLVLVLAAGRMRAWRTVGARGWVAVGASVLFTAQMFPLPFHYARPWVTAFVLGMICYVFRQRVRLSVLVACPLMGVETWFLGGQSAWSNRMFPWVLSYFVVTLAYHPAVQVPAFRRLGDYSYGLYIYAWPLQQLLEPRFPSALGIFFASYPLSLGVAVLSWHFLEEPMLGLKHRLSRRWLVAKV